MVNFRILHPAYFLGRVCLMAGSMTKSAVNLARLSLQVAQAHLPAYAHKFSPQRYTQPQLFSLLVLRQFFQTDYRGIVVLLAEWSELRSTLGLKQVPHYSTLCYAAQRLGSQPVFETLLQQTLQQAQAQQVIDAPSDVAVDATGLETHHASRYYIQRQGTRTSRSAWLKLSLACHLASHLFAGAVASQGPSQDSPQFPSVMRQATHQLTWTGLLADAGYDAEHNHRLCRETLGIPTPLIALNKRGTGRKWPKTPYRRQMKRSFSKARYHQRWQIESAIARHKRRLGGVIQARSLTAQIREGYLRGITHNLMILQKPKPFQQSKNAS